MFSKSDADLAATLAEMQNAAYRETNCNQTATVERMAQWIGNDRRFDQFPNKHALAREAVDARQHGRVLDLSGKPKFDSNPMHVASVPDYPSHETGIRRWR